jgi:hypothetical protein
MKKPLAFALRLLALAAVLAFVSVILGPVGVERSPYTSALSDLAATDAYAGRPGNCTKSCVDGLTCERATPGARCVLVSGGGCRNFPC